MSRALCLLLLIGAALAPALAADALPQGDGLAAKYPGDAGIRQDKAVIFADGFESYQPTWEGEWPPSWDGLVPPRTEDPRHVHTGTHALELTAQPSKDGRDSFETLSDTAGHLHRVPAKPAHASVYTWYDAGTFRGSTGYEQVFARWYVMFAPGFDPADLEGPVGSLVGARTHWWIVAFDPTAKPDGANLYTAGVSPSRGSTRRSALGPLVMSTIYPDMKPDAQGRYLGTAFPPQSGLVPTPGRWYCLEVMLKPNSPDKADGEQALWVDGKLIGHWTGLRYRTTDSLRVNGFWLQLSAHRGSHPNTMWCDDIVIAKSYIGPMKR